jgi:hypothetical protein
MMLCMLRVLSVQRMVGAVRVRLFAAGMVMPVMVVPVGRVLMLVAVVAFTMMHILGR